MSQTNYTNPYEGMRYFTASTQQQQQLMQPQINQYGGGTRQTTDPFAHFGAGNIDAFVEEKIRKFQSKYGGGVWWNPDDDIVYTGEEAINHPNFSPENRAYNVGLYKKQKAMLKTGSITDPLAMREDPWFPEFREEAKRVLKYDQHNGQFQGSRIKKAAAGAITSDDNPTIHLVQILAETMGRDTRVYSLEQVVSQAQTPGLSLSLDTWSGFGISMGVPEGIEPLPQKGKYVRQEYLMGKDVAHVLITDEAGYRADRDLMAEHITHAQAEFRRAHNLKIAIALEAAPQEAGSDWGAIDTGGFHYAADPSAEIGVLIDLIDENSGVADVIASHSTVFRKFLSNGKIGGLTAPAANVTTGTKLIQNPPTMPGMTWALDNLKSRDVVTVFDRRAVIFGQGPVRTGTYRQEGRGADGYITRDWNRCIISDPSRVYNLTGVAPDS